MRRKREGKRVVLEEQRRAIREEQQAVALCLKVASHAPKVGSTPPPPHAPAPAAAAAH